MFERRSMWIRILAGVLLAAVLVGAGFFIFRAGQASGLAISQAQGAGGQTTPGLPAPYGFRGHVIPYAGFGWHFFPPFGLFFLCLGPFLFLFLFGGLFRWIFWGRAWHHGYGPHPWHGQPPAGTPGQTPEPPAQEPSASGQQPQQQQ